MESFASAKIRHHRNIIFLMCAVPIIVISLVTSVFYYVSTSNNNVDAALTFGTGFENGSLSDWGGGQCMNSYSCTASTTAPREGRYASRYEVRDGDCPVTGDRCYGERAERQGGNIGSSFSSVQGQNRWYGWSMKLENGFSNSTGWQVLSQWHSSSNGSPAVSYKLSGRTLFMEHYSPAVGYKHQWYSTINTGQWYDLKMNINWSSGSDGYVRLWINGQEQPRYSGPTLRAGESTYFKQGYYRDQNVSGTGIVYYDNLKVATSEADLGGTPSPAPQPPAPQPQPSPPAPTPSPTPPPVTQVPFQNTPRSLPGRIQAEDYDLGGEGVAYHDLTNSNQGNAYRQEGVDIEASGEGGYNVGYNDVGEWREHTVNAQAGNYTISARVSSAVSGGQLRVKLNGQTLGTLNVPNTGGWQNYRTVNLSNVSIAGGNGQILRFETVGNYYTINWIEFSRASNSAPSPSPSPSPAPQPSPSPSPSPTPSPRPPIIVPGANPTVPVPIPEQLQPEENGNLVADFNGDGLNEIANDSNSDGLIDPTTEIIVDGSSDLRLTDSSVAPLTVDEFALVYSRGAFGENENTSTVIFKLGPLPEVRIPKPVAYVFLIAASTTLAGLVTYLALTKLAILAEFRAKWGL